MVTELFDHVPVSIAAKDAVITRLQEAHRHYHNLDHVMEMWDWHCAHRGDDALENTVVASFCLYHDAIYDPSATDNECRSADLWLQDTDDMVSPLRSLVMLAILASADHFGYRTPLPLDVTDWCLNLDLLRLGVAEHQFTQHGLDIRAEYQHLTDTQWAKASAEFRCKVMGQPMIFQFEEFRLFEAKARHNLANALLRDWREMGYLT